MRPSDIDPSVAAATRPVPRHRDRRWQAWIAAVVALVSGGVVYRSVSAMVKAEMSAPILLDPPLRSLPLVLGDWHGTDVPLTDSVLRIAGNDDYVSRQYRNTVTGNVVGLYVAYTARPRTMLRHRPSVCYPSAGWTPAGESETVIELKYGRELPARTERFVKTGVQEQRVTVLYYYVLAGEPTIDDHSFWSLGWRAPNLARNASHYVAQVQITIPGTSATNDDVLARFVVETADQILRLLPDAIQEVRFTAVRDGRNESLPGDRHR